MGDDAAVQILMEEYRTLRAEILVSITAQQSTLTFGSGSLALLVSAGVAVREDSPEAAVAVFLVVVPLVCAFVLNSWLAELGRMFRAGSWLRQLERRVNEHVSLPDDPRPLLWWENGAHSSEPTSGREVADPEDVDRSYLRSIRSTLLSVGAISIVFGAVTLWQRVEPVSDGVLTWSALWMVLPVLVLARLGWIGRRSDRLYERADAFRTGRALGPHGSSRGQRARSATRRRRDRRRASPAPAPPEDAGPQDR